MILSTHGVLASQIQSFVGLLDTYPNAAAAYSVRRLTGAYSGSAIRVRRSSDNAEQDIGFSGANLDTSALTSFCGSGNGFVTTWYDQSGNARNATQTTAANQPQIVSSGSVILYGTKPTMTFDGLNDVLFSPFFAYQSAVSMYYVTQRVGNATGGGSYNPDISIRTTDGLDGGAFHYINPSFKGACYPFVLNGNSFPFGTYDNASSYANGDKYLINYEQTNSVGFSVYRNNAFEGGTSTAGNIPTNNQGFQIAHQANILRYAYNNFCEIIMWNSNQSSNRSAINSDMNTYFSVY